MRTPSHLGDKSLVGRAKDRPTQQRLISDAGSRHSKLFPFLDLNSYYNFISTAMIVLFVVGLVIVFVYEYEALRRTKA